MPRGPERQWRAQKQPQTDQLIAASVQQGMVDPAKGFYAELIYGGIETEERAVEIKRSLFRCGKRMNYSIRAQIQNAADGTFQIQYRAIDKTKAREWMIQNYGADRTKWPYNPRARNAPRSQP